MEGILYHRKCREDRNFQIHLSSKFKICISLVFLNEVKYNSISFIPPTKKCHPERKARYGEKKGEEAFSRRKSSAINLFYLEFCLRTEGKLFISSFHFYVGICMVQVTSEIWDFLYLES